MIAGAPRRACPACGRPLSLVWVHGHGQCSACGTNVVPCCMGSGDEADVREPGALRVGIDTLVEILAERGPQLEQDLLNEFSGRTGCALGIGRVLLLEAITLERVERTPRGILRARASTA